MRSAPALVLIFAVILLGEQVSYIGVLGIVLVALGVYSINMKKITVSEMLVPIKSIFREKATKFAFITMILVAIYSIVHKIAVSYIHPIIFTYLFIFIGTLFLAPYIFYFKDRSLITYEWQKNKKAILINGFFGIFGYSLILIAFTIERVSYIVGLRQLSVILAVLLGGHVLKEKHKLIRFSAAALIFVGAFLISTAK